MDKSYGIHVAKLAGLPSSLLDRADTILTELESEPTKTISANVTPTPTEQITPAPIDVKDQQMSLFAEQSLDENDEQVLHALRHLDLMGKTPMQVMNQVYRWQQKLNKETSD
ncbi:hypothetical protein [Lentilactobacillus senioris]|uniref:hypothetical protein n=1 Tax=Lentilactobacillus senioris TaxID=931534 RepID=UPI000A6E3239|nr:hypothetical protein [Lentilactobacillus senioris]